MKTLRNWLPAGAVFTMFAGTLLHFVHDWLGGNLTAVFGAVNESTWEHLKLIFWPMVLFGIFAFAVCGRTVNGFLPAYVLAVCVGMLAIVTTFYTYTGIIGRNFLALDIATFFIGVIAAYAFAYQQLKSPGSWLTSRMAGICAAIALLILIVCFAVFTFRPPHIALFQDPVNGLYGI